MVYWIKETPPQLQAAVKAHLQGLGNNAADEDIFVDDGIGDDSATIATLEGQGKTVVMVSDLG